MITFAQPLAALYEDRGEPPAWAPGPQQGSAWSSSVTAPLVLVECAIIATTEHEFLAVDVEGRVFLGLHALFTIRDDLVANTIWSVMQGS